MDATLRRPAAVRTSCHHNEQFANVFSRRALSAMESSAGGKYAHFSGAYVLAQYIHKYIYTHTYKRISAYTCAEQHFHVCTYMYESVFVCVCVRAHSFPSHLPQPRYWRPLPLCDMRSMPHKFLLPPFPNLRSLLWLHCSLRLAVLDGAKNTICVYVCYCTLTCGGHPVYRESFLRAFCSLRFIDVVKSCRIMPDALKCGRKGIEKEKFCNAILCALSACDCV